MHQMARILPEIDEKILIHNSLMKSNKIQLMNTLNLEEQTKVRNFINYLMTNFASDSFIRRRAFENIKQDEEETAGSFFRRVIYEYRKAKGINEMPIFELAQNQIFRNDITYSFTNGLKNKTLQTKVLTSDIRFEDLEQKVNMWENLFKRAATINDDINNINVMRCWSCGSSSHMERDCRASDKNKRQWNKKKERRHRSSSNPSGRSKSPYSKYNKSYSSKKSSKEHSKRGRSPHKRSSKRFTGSKSNSSNRSSSYNRRSSGSSKRSNSSSSRNYSPRNRSSSYHSRSSSHGRKNDYRNDHKKHNNRDYSKDSYNHKYKKTVSFSNR